MKIYHRCVGRDVRSLTLFILEKHLRLFCSPSAVVRNTFEEASRRLERAKLKRWLFLLRNPCECKKRPCLAHVHISQGMEQWAVRGKDGKKTDVWKHGGKKTDKQEESLGSSKREMVKRTFRKKYITDQSKVPACLLERQQDFYVREYYQEDSKLVLCVLMLKKTPAHSKLT
jgi:hypothetical protein